VTLTTRPALPDDVDAVTALEQACFPTDPWSRNLVAQGVAGETPTTTFLVAVLDGTVVGHAVLSVVSEDAELQRIATTAARRRTGVATALLAAVTATAADGGAVRLLLEVREDNRPALRFYARERFTEIARRPGYYRDGTTAVILERHL